MYSWKEIDMHTYRKFMIVLIAVISVSILIYLFYSQKQIEKQSVSSDEVNTLPEDIVLDYYIWDDETSYIQPVVNAYTSFHKNIQINLHSLESLHYDEVIKLLLDGDTKMDIVGIRGISLIVQMMKKNQLLDITDEINKKNIDVTVYGNMYNNISIDGDYFALPTRSTCWFLLYNKGLFDQAGVSYPTEMTWDEYRELAIQLTQGSSYQKVYGGCWPPWFFNFGAVQRSSYLIDDDLTYTKESLELLNNFYNEDGSHISYKQVAITTDEEIDFTELFEKNKIAMMPQGEWMINMLLEYEKTHTDIVEWDIAPMPIFEGQESNVTWGQYQFAAIAKDTAYPEECFEFLQFLCGEEGARIFAEHGIIHAYSTDEIKQLYMDSVGKESASYFYEAKRVQEELAVPRYQDLYAQFRLIAADFFLEKITIDQAMEQIETIRTSIYDGSTN